MRHVVLWSALLSACVASDEVPEGDDGDTDSEAEPCVPTSEDDAWGDGVDANCDGSDGVDGDGDGAPAAGEGVPDELVDCADDDADVAPGADDPFGDGIDTDCDGFDGIDRDGDGYATNGTPVDCADDDPDVHPGVPEDHPAACDNGVDDDCDGGVDEDDLGCPLPPACGTAPSCRVPFEEVTDCAGIVVGHAPTTGDRASIGPVWGDVDRDGWLDLYATNNAGPSMLYRNRRDGTFELFSFASDVALSGRESSGASLVDVDGDGWLDLYVLSRGPNALFRNDDGQGFTDVTEGSGLDDPGQGETANWGDYDGDGDLDVYLSNYLCAPEDAGCEDVDPRFRFQDRLFRNEGDFTFTDVTEAALGFEATNGYGFAASWSDIDLDGDLDLYVVNDRGFDVDDADLPTSRNVLFLNEGPGCGSWCFTEVGEARGADERICSMGVATADFDGDGSFDFVVSDNPPARLQLNDGDGFFTTLESDLSGLDTIRRTWGMSAVDYDLDGAPDLVFTADGLQGGRYVSLWRNDGGTFSHVFPSGLPQGSRSYGVAWADYDRDGWPDLLVGMAGRYALLRNVQGVCGETASWSSVRPVGDGDVPHPPAGIRAVFELSDGTTLHRQLMVGTGLGSQDDVVLHTGTDGATVTRITLTWPDGTEQTIDAPTMNRELVVTPP